MRVVIFLQTIQWQDFECKRCLYGKWAGCIFVKRVGNRRQGKKENRRRQWDAVTSRRDTKDRLRFTLFRHFKMSFQTQFISRSTPNSSNNSAAALIVYFSHFPWVWLKSTTNLKFTFTMYLEPIISSLHTSAPTPSSTLVSVIYWP